MDVESRTVPSGIKFEAALLVKCDAEPVFKKAAAAMPPKLLYKPEFVGLYSFSLKLPSIF